MATQCGPTRCPELGFTDVVAGVDGRVSGCQHLLVQSVLALGCFSGEILEVGGTSHSASSLGSSVNTHVSMSDLGNRGTPARGEQAIPFLAAQRRPLGLAAGGKPSDIGSAEDRLDWGWMPQEPGQSNGLARRAFLIRKLCNQLRDSPRLLVAASRRIEDLPAGDRRPSLN
jgi:hypothetical protein